MDKYSKYLASNNSNDNAISIKSNDSVILDIEDITEQSTPKEISNFVSKKLIEFMESELKKTKSLAKNINFISAD